MPAIEFEREMSSRQYRTRIILTNREWSHGHEESEWSLHDFTDAPIPAAHRDMP